MKECGILEITSVSIHDFLCDTFHKDLSKILISDSLLVESLTIDGKNLDGEKQVISFLDLKKFKNLRYLEIANTLISCSVLSILADSPYLETVIFRNCAFSKQVKSMNMLTSIKSLKIMDCDGFHLSFISGLSQIERIYLKGMRLSSFRKFEGMDLISLDISYCSLKSTIGIENFKTDHLIVNENQFQLLQKCKSLFFSKIVVMADFNEGYYIKELVH